MCQFIMKGFQEPVKIRVTPSESGDMAIFLEPGEVWKTGMHAIDSRRRPRNTQNTIVHCAGWGPLTLAYCLSFTHLLALGLSLVPICAS